MSGTESGVVVGVGASVGVAEAEVLDLIGAVLAEVGVAAGAVRRLATVEQRATEPGLLGAARTLGVPLVGHPAGELGAVAVPSPSPAVLAATGTASVAEAAALLGGGELLIGKRKSARSTVAVATLPTVVTAEPAAPAAPTEPDLRHHGDAEVRGAGLVDLAVNVRTGTPPAWLRAALTAALGDLAAYPEQSAARAAVAARHGRPAAEVLLTAGAAEAFVLLARTLRPRHAVVVHPQFTEPEAALRDAGIAVHRVLLEAADGFRLGPDAVPEQADLVVIGNPTNPTSVLHPAAALAALARPGRTLVVDEAFMDTVPGETASLAGPHQLPGQVVVLRSLTKTWGLAGLRIGYLLAPAALVAELAGAQPLWPVSSLGLLAAELCSAAPALAEAEAAARQLGADRRHLLERLAALPGVRVHGTPAASFVLIELAGADRVRERLRAAGFAVRRGDTFPGLGTDWLRLAVRDRATVDAFAEALARCR
ncbi:Rv2231c family pyridoxal phosphate-dependent protein CobC [Kitasatospora sp. NBC_01287]|uniref:Rv2231c family pyridoxal phosphate-dependent protein CobC n=1 Tax=Kitasatospora sp. NBC_01287 TaxID=2903573 RepID=UPI0022520909|nr:Rv2231c family pyridoxal phosphate-dependent protein CobC [Kitasatospora sp. NBC_01287]MCX4746135.1 Rv2231c family pyridoxal phosphate-dependent protein CobC [Kitasatospora sp. NBC_01287]